MNDYSEKLDVLREEYNELDELKKNANYVVREVRDGLDRKGKSEAKYNKGVDYLLKRYKLFFIE